MINSNRECQIKGHQDSKPTRICVFMECNQFQRWCCAECVLEKLHLHGQSNENHIKKQQDFIEFIKLQQRESINIKSQLFSAIQLQLNKLKIIVQSTMMLISQLEKLQTNIQQSFNKNYEALISQGTKDFLSFKNDQINNIITVNNYGVQQDHNDSNDIMKTLINQCQELVYLYSNKIKPQANQVLEIKYNFSNYYEQEDDKKLIYTFQISPNEKLAAFGGYASILCVVNLETKQKIKEIKLANLMRCKFSNDSQLIYCGDKEGFIYCYDIKQAFKEIYKNKIHSGEITTINLQNNHQVISSCSTDNAIIVTDIKANQQYKIVDGGQYINQIEVDQIWEMYISCSDDGSIKFFSQKQRNIIIDQQNAHDTYVCQIQLTQNNNNLLSRSLRELRYWQIQRQERKLILLKKIIEQEDLFSFATFHNDNRIVKIYSKYLQVQDNRFQNLSQYKHNIDQLWSILFQLFIISGFKCQSNKYDEFYISFRKTYLQYQYYQRILKLSRKSNEY